MAEKHLFRDEWLTHAASTLPGVSEQIEKFRAQRLKSLFDALVNFSVADDATIREAIRAKHRIESADGSAPDKLAATLVPERVCRRYRLVPLRLSDETIEVAMENPLDLEALADIQAVAGRTPVPLFARAQQIDSLLTQAYDPDVIVNELVEKIGEETPIEVLSEESENAKDTNITRPVELLVSSLIAKAFNMRASDIHLEHDEKTSVVRFRIDGSLKTILSVPRAVGAGQAVSRIKIMANLDIADRMRPQDGRAKIRISGHELGLRVSTLPTNFGEKVVIRLLDNRAAEVPFEKLGFRPDIVERLSAGLRLSQGLVLITGPTGSGKTTTLYSIVNRLKDDSTNIVTVEDPIEFKLEGINQTQVQEKQGLTFAGALRSVLRQDPDVILVGEIRDRETAETAMQAAATGHLVISSLHTNDAISTVTRLLDIGIERYNLAPSLIAVTAQRLVRSLCPACRKPAENVNEALAAAQRARGIEVREFVKVGCDKCGMEGYKGRTSLVELLEATPGVKQKISAGLPDAELRDYALGEKSLSTLLDDALWHIGRGDTTLEEVLPFVNLIESRPKSEAPSPGFGVTPSKTPQPKAAPRAGAAKVLIADDDMAVRIILRKLLETDGYIVEEAEDGAKALASVASSAPDMLLIDLNMPGLDGYGVIRGVRESLGLSRLPILMLTADPDDRSQVHALELGADDYIVKPIKSVVVAARVKAAFRRLEA